jgi:hypothetical protein
VNENMAENAYKVLKDTSFAYPLRTAVTIDGVEVEETTGRAYAEGDYVFEHELAARVRGRLENGELDDFLESVPFEEAEEGRRAVTSGLHIPEHEAERYALLDAGHRVVERDQVLSLRSAGAEAARANLEASREGPDDNPQITEQPSFVETPNLVDVAHGEVENVPVGGDGKQPEVTDADVETAKSASTSGVEMPPGLPVGPTLAKAEGADPDEVDGETEKAAKKAARKRPGGSSSESASGGSGS